MKESLKHDNGGDVFFVGKEVMIVGGRGVVGLKGNIVEKVCSDLFVLKRK